MHKRGKGTATEAETVESDKKFKRTKAECTLKVVGHVAVSRPIAPHSDPGDANVTQARRREREIE